MKRNWKKVLGLLLVLCLVASLFAACSSNNNSSP